MIQQTFRLPDSVVRLVSGFNPGSTLSAMDFEGIGREANTHLAARSVSCGDVRGFTS